MSIAEVDEQQVTTVTCDGDAPVPVRSPIEHSLVTQRVSQVLGGRPVRLATARPVRGLLVALAPGLVYLGVRELGLLVLGWMAAANQASLLTSLTIWDGQWYTGIAAHGYGGVPRSLVDAFGHRTPDTALAFFPGYPAVVRLVAWLPGVAIVPAALVTSMACGVVASFALARIGRLVSRSSSPAGARRTGLIFVALFAASPMAIVLSMAYSEAMFCALAAWALVGVLERRWLLAGACALLAGLVRPTAMAIVLTVVAAAVVALIEAIRSRGGVRAILPPVAGIVLAPLGLAGYLGYVAYRTGQASGWFGLQAHGWNSQLDGGVATARYALEILASGRSVLEVASVGLLVVGVVVLVVSPRRGVPWPLVLYGAAVLALDIGSNGVMNSKARLMLPAVTLLLPFALSLAERRPRTVLTVLACVAIVSAWFGAYAVTGWQWAI